MILRLWRGYHSLELNALLLNTWKGNDLTILCPPNFDDFSFLKFLPRNEIKFSGDWNDDLKDKVLFESKSVAGIEYPEHPILGVFTSGTVSGSPRLVLYSRSNIVSSLEGVLSVFEREKIEMIFCYPQAFHTFGLTLGYILSIYLGVELKMAFGKYGRNAHAIRVQLSNPNLLTIGTPTHFYDLIEYVKSESSHLEPSYSSIVGGAIVTNELWKQMQSVLKIAKPSIGYGCTEASPAITHLRPGEIPNEDGEIGLPLPNLRSIATAHGVEISGPSLCLAIIYKDQIEFPKSLIIPDEIELNQFGRWRFCGRFDWVINRGGSKLSPEFIESHIRTQLGLTSVCVGVLDQRLGQEIAIIVCSPNKSERLRLAHQLQNFFESQFGFRIKSERIIFDENLPINRSGKVDRKVIGMVISEKMGSTIEEVK